MSTTPQPSPSLITLEIPRSCLMLVIAEVSKLHPAALADRTLISPDRRTLSLDMNGLALQIGTRTPPDGKEILEVFAVTRQAFEAVTICNSGTWLNNPYVWKQSCVRPALEKITAIMARMQE